MTDSPDPLGFTPVASTSTRHDGWTPERQRLFIEALSKMGVVARAARAVGKSAVDAYALRRRPDASSFVEAWDIAIDMGRESLFALAIERATHGYTVPRFYRGQQVGTVHKYDNRMILAALKPVAAPSCRTLPSVEELAAALREACNKRRPRKVR